MPKLYKIEDGMFVWHCPACECLHHINTDKSKKPYWDFNGDLESPSFSPSVKVRGGGKGNDFVCHFFVKGGKINFCSDSTHRFAGRTVEIPEWE